MGLADTIIKGAQQNVVETAPDIAGAIDKGSQIALRQEQAEQGRKKLEQQKLTIKLKQMDSFADAVFKMDKMEDPKQQRLFQTNFLPKMAAAAGIELDKGQIDFIATPENRAKLAYVKSLAEQGKIGPEVILDIMKNPEGTLPDVDLPEAIRQGLTVGQIGSAISEGTSKFLGRKSQERTRGFRESKEEQRQKEKFDTMATETSKRVTAAFKPLMDAKDGVRIGRKALDQLLLDAKAGKTLNENLFNTAARGIAKAFNKGAMTEQDVADFKELKGFLGKGEEFTRKWIVGGVNLKVVKNLIAVTDITSKILDRRATETATQMQNSFTSTAFPGREAELRKRSGLDRALEPTLKKQEKEPASLGALTLDAYKKAKPAVQAVIQKQKGLTHKDILKRLGDK